MKCYTNKTKRNIYNGAGQSLNLHKQHTFQCMQWQSHYSKRTCGNVEKNVYANVLLAALSKTRFRELSKVFQMYDNYLFVKLLYCVCNFLDVLKWSFFIQGVQTFTKYDVHIVIVNENYHSWIIHDYVINDT